MIKAKLTKLTLSVTVTVLFTQTMSTQHSTAQQTMIKLPTSSSISCDEAIKSTKANLKQKGLYEPRMFLKGVPRPYRIEPSITFNDTDIEHYYYNYPVDRKRTVYIRTAGELYKLANLFDSPQFMTIISSKIIKACPQVGIVFFEHYIEGGQPVGYFSDETARTFKWVQFNSSSHTKQIDTGEGKHVVYEWGYFFAP